MIQIFLLVGPKADVQLNHWKVGRAKLSTTFLMMKLCSYIVHTHGFGLSF